MSDKQAIPTISVKRLREELSIYPDDWQIGFGGLHYARIKARGDALAIMEFNEQVHPDKSGALVVQSLE